MSTVYQHPFPESTVTSEWGATKDRPNAHRGRDYAPGGPPIPPWCDGTVVRSEYQTGLGWVVTVEDDEGWFTSACHLREKGAAVGTRVRRGVGSIGVVGNTGTLSKGRHLHFVVSLISSNPATGATVNPKPFLDARLAVKVTPASGASKPLPIPQEEPDMQLSDKISLPDGKGGEFETDLNNLLRHLFVHSGRASEFAEAANKQGAQQPFSSSVLVDAAGKPIPVSVAVLTDHTRAIVGGIDAKVTAFAAALETIALAQGLDPQQLVELIAQRVDVALADNFAAIPSAVSAELGSKLS